MKRILKVTLEIEVEDMTEAELADAGFYDDEDEEEGRPELLLSGEYEAREIADLLPGVVTHPDNEMFAGSGIFVKVADVKVSGAEWA